MRILSHTTRLIGLAGAAGVLLVGAACDSNQGLVFRGAVEGVDPIIDLGLITPVDAVGGSDGLAESVIYGEVGPTGTPEDGGVTFNVAGNNGSICVWVDPETVFWNQSVSPTSPSQYYRLPDNPYDDGDLDMDVGQSLYYTGTPGEQMGTFEVRYEDSNGEVVPIKLTECGGPAALFSGAQSIGKGGRASPEYCTIANTVVGVTYTVVMSTWSTPIDDDRLGFGLLVMNGDCQDLINNRFDSGGGGPGVPGGSSALSKVNWECLIKGESVKPGEPGGAKAAQAGLPERTWLGRSEVPSWERSIPFEEAFCRREANEDGPGLIEFCNQERNRVRDAGNQCAWNFDATVEEGLEHCYCGDREDTPSAGAN